MPNKANLVVKLVVPALVIFLIATSFASAGSSVSFVESAQPRQRTRVGDIAIAATGKSYRSKVDDTFAKCEYFIIGDPVTKKFKVVRSPYADAAAGGGVSVVEMMAKRGVRTVIVGDIGPNAHRSLSHEGIKVLDGKGETVRSAIEKYNAGELYPIHHPRHPREWPHRRGPADESYPNSYPCC
ncbi:MAG TPA: hypothetical protein HA346_01250 [Thermoplasmata archaeon]|nr:hypothetical protein [Thermoplasmata archaeon]